MALTTSAQDRDNAGAADGLRIGPIGTVVRGLTLVFILRGIFFTGDPPQWWQYPVGLVGLPILYVVIQAAYARWRPRPSPWIGPIAWIVVGVPALILYFMPTTSAAITLTVALTILMSIVRGNADCEATVVGNWVLRRSDRLWCPLFSPVDALERRLRRALGAR